MQYPMISAVAGSTAGALLALERQVRRDGSGIRTEQLPGCWVLQQTWTRQGDAPAPGSATMLRWLKACLILNRCDQGLTIVNQVTLLGFLLRFSGSAHLRGTRPLLMFSFSTLEVCWADQVLLRRPLPDPSSKRLPFFALIELNEPEGRLTARGRGGGLALWSRMKEEST